MTKEEILKEIAEIRRLVVEWSSFKQEDSLADVTRRTAKREIKKLEKKQKKLYDQLNQ